MALRQDLATHEVPRYRLEDLGNDLLFILPVRKRWLWMLWEILFFVRTAPDAIREDERLLNHVAVLFFGIQGISNSSESPDLIELILSTLILVIIIYDLLWRFFGLNTLRVGYEGIVTRPEIFGLGLKKTYSATEIRNLRVSTFTDQRTSGVIRFDYDSKTIKALPDVEATEAKQILETIRRRFPQYFRAESQVSHA